MEILKVYCTKWLCGIVASHWRDKCLNWICGFTNAKEGNTHIGKDYNGKVVGLANATKLLKDISNKTKVDIITVTVVLNKNLKVLHLTNSCFKKYL